MGAVQQVYVHIGPHKTGTTYLQNILWRNRSALAETGISVPGDEWPAQRRSVAKLVQRPPGVRARPAPKRRSPRDAWDRLLAEVDASGAHTVLLSVERLCTAESHAVEALVQSFAPSRVDVVYTGRDLARVIPGAWQTRIRNRAAPTWREYLASVRCPGDAHTDGGRFWRQQDPAQSLPAWLDHVPSDRVHVVTTPPAGSPPQLLWERFCDVVVLEPDHYDLDVPRSNVSLGGVEAEVLRRLSARVAQRLPLSAYVDLVNHFVAREVLEQREQSFRLVLPETEHAWLAPRAEAAVGYLRRGGFRVVGDLGDLVPVPEAGARLPDDVSAGEVVQLLDEVLGATLLEIDRRQQASR